MLLIKYQNLLSIRSERHYLTISYNNLHIKETNIKAYVNGLVSQSRWACLMHIIRSARGLRCYNQVGMCDASKNGRNMDYQYSFEDDKELSLKKVSIIILGND